ncbi:MAG: DUF4350 domain-containing protein [Dermatophilaceae bacterium]
MTTAEPSTTAPLTAEPSTTAPLTSVPLTSVPSTSVPLTTAPLTTAPSASPGPSGAASGRRCRLPSRRAIAYVVVVGLGVVLLGMFAASSARPQQFLDSNGGGPQGGRALAEVLRSRGVEVEVARSIGALERATVDDTTTVMVTDPEALSPGATARLRQFAVDAGRLVLVGGASEQLETLRIPAQAFPGGDVTARSRCDAGGARPADVLRVVGTAYLLDDPDAGTACFALPDPDGDPEEAAPDAELGSAFIVLPPGSGRPETLLVGFGPALTNEFITDGSHAGLGVRALGATDRLIWYQPGVGDRTAPGPSGETDELQPIWPVWTMPASALIGAVVVLLAVARGRRLGRLVREPLPVVVRATETTESRGRLYRRSGDRARAAEVLRSATRERCAQRLALGRRMPFPAIVVAVAGSTGRSADEVAAVLGGAPPSDDAALVHLARQLIDLEESVRT